MGVGLLAKRQASEGAQAQAFAIQVSAGQGFIQAATAEWF